MRKLWIRLALAGLVLCTSAWGIAPLRHLVSVPVAAQDAAPKSIPAQLSDAEFWSLSTGLSEPGGYFQSDNYVGNELSFQWVIPSLKKAVAPGGVYLGVAPDQNFTYITALQPRMAFLVDIREGNLLEILMYKALIETSATRAEFAAKLFGRTTPPDIAATASANDILQAVYARPAEKTVHDQTAKLIEEHLTKTHGFPLTPAQLRQLIGIYDMFYAYGPGITYQNSNRGNAYPTYWDMQVTDDNQGHNHGYLQTDEAFRAIKRLFTANLLVPVVGNFGGPKAIRAVGTWVREHGGVVTTFYTSNVEQYLFQDNLWREYYKNVATLPLDGSSQFIRSVFNMGFGGGYGGGLRSAQLTCSIQDLLTAFAAGKINSYYDVIALSR